MGHGVKKKKQRNGNRGGGKMKALFFTALPIRWILSKHI
jgi:hypothetical protein